LARAHCAASNQWAVIGRFLPGRSENTIKNKWWVYVVAAVVLLALVILLL